MKPWIWLVCIAPSLAAAAQKHPTNDCPFDGFSANPRLGETLSASAAFYGCGIKPGCLSMNLRTGQPVILFQTSGDWTCGYIEDSYSAAPAWVATANIREIEPDTNAPVPAWLGHWRRNGDVIQMKPAGGKIGLTGHATWHGNGDVEHSGDLNGIVTPSGNHIHYSEGAAGCTLDLTLFGKYIVANDNAECGGANVRFWGLWKRSP